MSLQVCWLCHATKGADDNLSMCFTNISRTASWRNTILQTVPWHPDHEPSYLKLKGFDLAMVVPDLLHVWNLGVARDVIGSTLRVILSGQVVFGGPTIPDRMHLATESLKRFARGKRLPLRLKKLTKNKIGWESKKFPSFASSGYDAYVVGLWLEYILTPHERTFPEIYSVIWSSNKVISLMYEAGHFLSQKEKASIEILGDVFARGFLSLANAALQQNTKLWRVKPKFHLLYHIFFTKRTINMCRYSTWMDEDFLKKRGKTLQLTAAKGAQQRLLERWLMSLPVHLNKILRS